jgi:hypothetical protein
MNSIGLGLGVGLTDVPPSQEEGTPAPPPEDESFDPDAFDVDAFDPDAFAIA